MTVFLTIYAAVALAYWLFMAYGAFRLNGLPRLSRIPSTRPDRWPRVSVVVPACNEADKVGAAARTLVAEEYPDLEIILVDDRSTDDTGAVMDRVAAGDPRARVIHISELPDGWLGKVHALDTGFKASTGEFVLFTDADVHFTPGTIRLAMAHAIEKGIDHLAALPNLYPTNLLLDAALSTTIRQIMVFMRPWKLNDPESRAYAGVGAFNLVRRSALSETPGFEWLRLETADDVGLGLMMKRFGKSSRMVTAFDLIGLHWYRSFREVARGAEKGWASALHFSLARAFLAAVAALALELAPVLFLEMCFLGWGPLLWVAPTLLLLYLLTTLTVWSWVGGRPWPHLISLLAAPILVALVLRTAWLGWRRGGVLWRGTLYPTEALRQGQRVHFP